MTTLKTLIVRLRMARRKLDTTKLYFHHRNTEIDYRILHLAVNAMTEEITVVYTSDDPANQGVVWTRDYKNFMDKVPIASGVQLPRFIPVHHRTTTSRVDMK